MKKYLFVMRRMPHLGCHVQESLDQMLTTAAFDQQVGVLFADDGVLQLKRGQNADAMIMRNSAAMFQVLEMYDIKQLYAEAESLAERGLTADELLLPVQLLARNKLPALINEYDVLIPG